MKNPTEQFKKVISHAKEYGFIFPSSEIYEGLGAVYDYGQNGVTLKNNIRDYWWKAMVQFNDYIVGLDSAILMHPKVWEASGHVEAFNDPLIDNKDSKKRYRADILIEDHLSKIEAKIDKDCAKAKKRFGSNFNKTEFISTNSRVLERQKKIDEIMVLVHTRLQNIPPGGTVITENICISRRRGRSFCREVFFCRFVFGSPEAKRSNPRAGMVVLPNFTPEKTPRGVAIFNFGS